jgi:hypothetical protein
MPNGGGGTLRFIDKFGWNFAVGGGAVKHGLVTLLNAFANWSGAAELMVLSRSALFVGHSFDVVVMPLLVTNSLAGFTNELNERLPTNGWLDA